MRLIQGKMILINPRRMHEGYGSHFVSECVCVCVTELAATYLVYTLKVGYHLAFCAALNIIMYCVDFLADHLCLLHFLMNSQWTKETVMVSF